MSACDILVIANLNMDLILEQKNSQQTSRKRYADSFTLSPGGNGYNEAVAAARMGATVALAGMIGSDSFGAQLKASLNEEITDKEIRLIGENGEQLGIVSGEEALRTAEEQGLDLVKISPQATPPVCKLMNYGKYKFEQSKREKEARKNQHVVEIKEIRMSPGIDVGDFNTKLKNAQKFLSDGNRVKVSVRFRGREMAHTEIGRDLLNKFAELCTEVSTLDKAAKLEGRNMSIFLSPKVGK